MREERTPPPEASFSVLGLRKYREWTTLEQYDSDGREAGRYALKERIFLL